MAAQAPPSLKAIIPYLKTAIEYDKRDPVVAYYCRLHAVQKGIKIDSKGKDSRPFLINLMDQLEMTKKELTSAGHEAISEDVVAQIHIDEKARQLFMWADTEDRAARFTKNVVKSFYTSSLLYDVLSQFGELSEEAANHCKYAKWKAAYIHKCLKSGETPIPGPAGGEDDLNTSEGGIAAPQQPPYPAGIGQPYYPNNATSGSGFYPADSSTANQAPYPTPPVQPQVNQPTPSAYQPVEPAADPSQPTNTTSSHLTLQDNEKAQKYCRFAASALQYEDVPTAIDNLKKALALLQSGSQ